MHWNSRFEKLDTRSCFVSRILSCVIRAREKYFQQSEHSDWSQRPIRMYTQPLKSSLPRPNRKSYLLPGKWRRSKTTAPKRTVQNEVVEDCVFWKLNFQEQFMRILSWKRRSKSELLQVMNLCDGYRRIKSVNDSLFGIHFFAYCFKRHNYILIYPTRV